MSEDTSDELTHLYSLFRGHTAMVCDRVRNKAFYNALSKRVKPNCSVLDIGSGTGLWAIVAAQLGAGRVLAIERDQYLIPIIQHLAQANGVADRVEAAHGDSRHLDLTERFDVIVSETIGNQGFDEQIIQTMLDGRKRLLKANGFLIPESVVLMAAAAHFRRASARRPAAVPLDYAYFDAMSANIPTMLTDRSKLSTVSDPCELLRIDLNAIDSAPDLGNLTATWKLDDTSKLNCVVVWAEATLAEGIEISTMQAPSWTPIVYSFEPFKAAKGELGFTLSQSQQIHYWTVALSGDSKETQSYSPVFAYTSLQAHMQSALHEPA